MVGELQGSLSVTERAAWSRYASVLLIVIIAVIVPWAGWDDARASTSVLHSRLFLLVSSLVGAVVAVTLALAPWWGKVGTRLIAAHLLIMGLYLGVAIATTNWSVWPIRGWWQGLWTLPLVTAQIQQILKLSRYDSTRAVDFTKR
jgi:hypothetical protein